MILLSTEFISKASSINHGLLGLLFAVLGRVKHVVNLSLQGVHGSLKTTLLSSSSGVDGGHLVDSTTGLAQFSLSLSFATLSRVKESSSLLHLTSEGLGSAVSKVGLLVADSGSLLIAAFSLTQLSLVTLDGLLGLVV